MSAKDTSAAAQRQIVPQDNPTVQIIYKPEKAPHALAINAITMIAQIQSVKAITTPKQLNAVDEIIADARFTQSEVEAFLANLRSGIERACQRVREIPGFEDFEGSFTCRKWGLRTTLNSGIGVLRNMRARFIADEEEKVRRANLAAQAEQDRINAEDARKAAAEAKKQGASRETIQEIKQAVMETPAPIIQSNVLDAATSSVRYTYSLEITDLKKFLTACIANPVMLSLLKSATPEIEKAFRNIVRDQKEGFEYPGAKLKKTPVDVGARR